MQSRQVRQTRRPILLIVLSSMLLALAVGCVAVLSERVRYEADRSLSFVQLRMQPDAYVGRLLILGGEIVRPTSMPGLTFLEVVQKPLDDDDRPLVTGPSEGRFMVRCERYLDPLVYTAGRTITLAGRVLGTHVEKIGATDVPYPLLSCVEIYAWGPPLYAGPVYPHVWYWWEWDPWYWDPWYWHHHHWRHRWYRRHR
ncbi:MAG: Slp family lipoprotein [Candidatus Tectimicrobiota bacterium]